MSEIATAFAEETTLQPPRLDAGIIVEIQEGLTAFARLSEAREAAVLDPTGAVLIRSEGTDRRADLDALGVLATASFTATKALAQRLGDRRFGGICHQGAERSLHVAPLARDFMLLTLHRADIRLEDLLESLDRMVPRINQRLRRETPRDGRKTA